MALLRPSEIFTEKEKDLAKDVYFYASQSYVDMLNPFANKEKLKENIIKWRDKLNELLDALEVK
jgi:hypothetical protein